MYNYIHSFCYWMQTLTHALTHPLVNHVLTIQYIPTFRSGITYFRCLMGLMKLFSCNNATPQLYIPRQFAKTTPVNTGNAICQAHFGGHLIALNNDVPHGISCMMPDYRSVQGRLNPSPIIAYSNIPCGILIRKQLYI